MTDNNPYRETLKNAKAYKDVDHRITDRALEIAAYLHDNREELEGFNTKGETVENYPQYDYDSLWAADEQFYIQASKLRPILKALLEKMK